MKTLLNFIREYLQFLLDEKDFRISRYQAESQDGDALVELKNEQLLIQLIKDRGQIEIYFANADHGNELFELSELVEIYTGKRPEFKSADPIGATFIKEHFDDIISLLTDERLSSIDKRDKRRSKKMNELTNKKSRK
jgi:hypothetical protein